MIVETPDVGDVGLVHVEGLTGWLIKWGQRLNGSPKADAKFEHSMLKVGKDWALEAEPGGAVVSKTSVRYEGRQITWVRPHSDLTDEQKAKIGNEATKLIGTPYSFLDYVALFGHRIGLPWFKKRALSTKQMICSQIIVEVYRRAGVELFGDTPSGFVTPADFMRVYGGMAS